jgi:hypothetical protein
MIEHLSYEYIIFAVILLAILIISFGSRARVFCQYLEYMTGIKLTPSEVMLVYRKHGKPGVRELFLDLLIRADLEDTSSITPDSPRAKPVAEMLGK